MSKLYPPVIETSIPAFSDLKNLYIPYELNRAVGFYEIQGFEYIIKSTITNKALIKGVSKNFDNKSVQIFFDKTEKEKLIPGGFYKVQLAFISNDETIGYYSNTGIVKYLGPAPELTVSTDGETFVGTYKPANYNPEKLYSYSFILKDSMGNIIEESDELLHNAAKDTGIEQVDIWIPKTGLDNGMNYNVTYSITTINGYKTSKSINQKPSKDDEGYLPNGIRLYASFNRENGYVELNLKNAIQNDICELIYGTFYIYKMSSKDNFTSKYKIAYFKLENQDVYEKTFKDFTVESGYSYKYCLQQINDYGIFSEEVYSKTQIGIDPVTKIPIYSDSVKVNFEHMYLFDGQKQLKIKFNPQVSTFKNVILETKTDTIGSKYPFISRNGAVKYKEFNLSGLISYQMDEENLFCEDYEIWDHIIENNFKENKSDKTLWTHNLTDESIAAEREFKILVMDWLHDGNIKLLKTPTEGNYLIRLMNVSLAPNTTLGRMLHTFSAQAYEVESLDKHLFVEGLSIEKNNRYIGYRTVPLYNFPLKPIAITNTDNQYEIVADNRFYEIIENNASEYVIAARFEDIKPGTQFEITLERGIETYVFNLKIGATGCHRIDRELNYHIKSIRLVDKDWITGDYGKDIVNNRGQVTYEFERKAKHNNFNDITSIDSNIAIAEPWYPSWYNVQIDEPILSKDNKQIYYYQQENSQSGYVEIAYFEGIEEPLFRGADYYYKENENQYYDLKGNPLTLSSSKGCLKNAGDAYYDFIPAKNVKSIDDDYSTDFLENQVTVNTNTNYLYQVYGKVSSGYLIQDNAILEEVKNIDGNLNIVYQKISGEKQLQVFVPNYDSQGNKIIKEKANGEEIQNPYYSKLLVSSNNKLNEFTTTSYKLVPLYNSVLESISSKETDVIYKNFIASKFYDTTNPNNEYYLKEQIKNIYSLDFELIQVFYQEDLFNKQNFEFNNGIVRYKDVIGNNNEYLSTERIVSGIRLQDDTIIQNAPSYQLINAERFADNISISIPNKHYLKFEVNNGEIIIQTDENDNQEYWLLYNYNSKDEFLEAIKKGRISIFKKIKLDDYIKDGYYFSKVDNFINENGEYYLNLYAQATKNYTASMTPAANEIIIVYEDNLKNPVRIDLTNRFSYSLSFSDYKDGLQGLSAIYLGKNVRGFVTFKRKKYSYKALSSNGAFIDLNID